MHAKCRITAILIMLFIVGELMAQNKAEYQGYIENALSKNECSKARTWYVAYKKLFGANDSIEICLENCGKTTSTKNTLNNSHIENSIGQFKTFIEDVNGVNFAMVAIYGDKSFKTPIPNFFMSATEVTQELWSVVMGTNPSYFVGKNLPVEQVSWVDCQQFLKKLNQITGKNYSLPSEKQWIYAVNDGDKKHIDIENNLNNIAWYSANSQSKTHIVASKKPNALGLYDMIGNVQEWCSDVKDSMETHHIIRGGCWWSSDQDCYRALKNFDSESRKVNDLGFRLVLVP